MIIVNLFTAKIHSFIRKKLLQIFFNSSLLCNQQMSLPSTTPVVEKLWKTCMTHKILISTDMRVTDASQYSRIHKKVQITLGDMAVIWFKARQKSKILAFIYKCPMEWRIFKTGAYQKYYFTFLLILGHFLCDDHTIVWWLSFLSSHDWLQLLRADPSQTPNPQLCIQIFLCQKFLVCVDFWNETEFHRK